MDNRNTIKAHSTFGFGVVPRKICIYLRTSALIFFSAFSISLASEGGITEFFISMGSTGPAGNSAFSDLYTGGFSLAAGARIPFSIWQGYQQNWFELEYDNFSFDKSGSLISYPYMEVNATWGRDVNVVTGIFRAKFMLTHESKKIVPFISIGFGYLHRSRTEIRSNSIDLPFVKISYKSAGAFLAGAGVDYKLGRHVAILFDFTYIKGNTWPGKIAFVPVRFGLIFRK